MSSVEPTVQELLARMASELTPEAAAEILQGLTAIAAREDTAATAADGARLRELYASYVDRVDLAQGQLVAWKSGLRNKRFPAYGAPAIVVQVLDEPIVNEENPASPYFRECLDVAVGFVDDEGDFVVGHFDSARLAPVEG